MPLTRDLTAQEIRELAADHAAALALAEALEAQAAACTGIAASWCPVHGDCSCPEPESGLDDHDCPLHSPSSEHAD